MNWFTRARDAVFVTSRLYMLELPAPTPRPAAAAPYLVRRATSQDLSRMATDLGAELTERKAALIAKRHTDPREDVFVAVLPTGEVCGYGHTQYGWIDDTHYNLNLGTFPKVAHLFDDFVAAAHRGHHLQVALIRARTQAAAERGLALATILVADTNHASRASVRRASFNPLLRVVTLRAGGRAASWRLGSSRRLR